MALFGVGLDVTQKRINTELRLFCAKNPRKSQVRLLRQLFQQVDTQNTNKVGNEEFVKCLNNFGFFLKKVDYQALIKYYDSQNEGKIQYNDYIDSLLQFQNIYIQREPLNQIRQRAVIQTFQEIDADKDGKIDFQEFELAFNLQSSNSYSQGKKSKADVLNQLFQLFDEDKDGTITKNEFLQYYTELSVGIPADTQFCNVLKLQWRSLQEAEQKPVDNKQLKDIINNLRYRLIQMTNGTHEDFLLRKIFNEFDVNRNGTLNLDEFYAMTIKLGCPIDRVFLTAVIEKFDKNQTGCMEYNEFVAFLLMDPYK